MKTILLLLILSTHFAHAEIQRLMELEAGAIYRGSQPQTTEDYQKLKSMGIKTIINLRWDASVTKSNQEASAHRFHFLNFPIKATDYPNNNQIQEIFEVLNDSRNHPIFIHCQFGKDRTGLVAALYRVLYQNWKPQQARNEWIQMGFAVRFLRNLDQYFSDSVK
jgi:tyrosine-protein phosphatase SIW14